MVKDYRTIPDIFRDLAQEDEFKTASKAVPFTKRLLMHYTVEVVMHSIFCYMSDQIMTALLMRPFVYFSTHI